MIELRQVERPFALRDEAMKGHKKLRICPQFAEQQNVSKRALPASGKVPKTLIEDSTMNTDMKQLSLTLTAPFPPDCVHWKPLSVKGNRALAAAYVDARAIMQRLDSVFGVGGWQDEYQLVNGGSVVCTLSVLVDGVWAKKTDVGSPSEQPDEGDRLKSAFSDALKRAACKLGIARYLYRLPRQWVDYDPQKKQFVKSPTLPAWALPTTKQSA